MTDEIPLDITGHEERDPPGDTADSSADDPAAASGDANSNGGGEPATVDAGEESATGEAGTERPAETTGEAIEDTDEDSLERSMEATGEGVEDVEEESVEPVEVLVQLAEDGEIDPWDIDIVEVTDKFLARLESDLRASGRALFYASVLLRMKSDAMLADDEPEPEPEPWETAMAGGEEPVPADPFAELEHEMDRRLERKRARGTPQTLDELVRDLREAERDSWWKESREYDTSGEHSRSEPQELDYRAAGDVRLDDEPTAAEATERTHGEDIEATIDTVSSALTEQYDAGRREVLFREISDAGESRVRTFLAVLFLSHRGEVSLKQDDLFGDLWIRDPAVTTGERAVAN